MIYIASPYTHHDCRVEEERYKEVMRYTAYLLRKKEWCYSPIVHCHEMAKEHQLPTTADFWFEYNFKMLKKVDNLHVLCIEGWNKSVGVASEVAWWRSVYDLPPIYIQHNPDIYTQGPMPQS